MKLAVVSAHYPPNFVSGGTLVPQRTSRSLRARGFDVSVFAGWLGEDREPGSEWDETDETGLPVHWIATTPWTGWADRNNFDNPVVTARFEAWIRRVAPDVVHCHSMQSLGVGPLRVAQQMGIPTVVTLHDFWWWCARQFLCTRDYTPCSLVVAAGSCPCEVDRPWLDERAGVVGPPLLAAARVVAVSKVTGDVALANGVDPGRLEVIENGIVRDPPAPDARTPPRPAGGLRLTYAGGPNPMKGSHVLAEAVGALASSGPWSLVAYGCEEVKDLFPAELVASGVVSTPPPYRPDELDAVLADTDVLVLPSTMRESYSILAREALSASVPVVTSASLGPEEVVVDGGNGLVVPAADPEALAAALDRVIDDPALLASLSEGCAAIRLPTLEQQTDRLVDLYERLTPAPTPSRRRHVGRVLFVVGIEAAPLRYRARLPAEGLELLGVHTDVRHYRDASIVELARRADAVVVYRVPATVQVLEFIAAARRRHTPVLFDVDDLIFDPALADEIPALKILPAEEADHWLEGVRRYRLTMDRCDAYIGSTDMLVSHAAAVSGLPAYRWSNGVGVLLGQLSDSALRAPRAPGPPRIGYLSGTNTHDHDWRHIEPAVARVLEENPDVELWLVGMVSTTERLAPFAGRVRRRGLLHWTELPGVLRDLDVNLAPMEPGSRFNEAKSAIKWLEAALTATPTVASPTGPFAEVITSGRNGVLAEDGTAWYQALTSLARDPVARKQMGAAARRDALLGLSPLLQGRRYLDILQSVAPRPRLADPPAPAALHHESLGEFPLEAYSIAAPLDAAADIEHQRHVAEPPVTELPGVAAAGGATLGVWRVRTTGLARTVRDRGPAAGARLLAGSARRRLAARRRS